MQRDSSPYLACGVRLFWDEVRQQHFLLFPEGAMKLNQTAWAILERCDRQHTIAEIVTELALQFSDDRIEADVYQLLTQLSQRGLLNDAIP
jgi:pyrroloquinoline quinone biosynthesis protein D